jgi:hypothetical protein
MLVARQRRLLALLEVLGGTVGNLDFQKLLFLYCQETGASSGYEFVPYRLGAFSFTSYADRRRMAAHGLIETDEQTWRLTAAGRQAAEGDRGLAAQVRTFAHRCKGLRGDELVAETYRRFPYYGTRSGIAYQVLRGDPAALRRIEAARPSRGPAGLLTIGYEGHSLESYLNRLLLNGVTLLCDVRRNPLSRKYGFSKGTLSKACEGVGIRYEHRPELGVPSDRRRTLDAQSDYDRLFREYERETLPAQLQALRQIQGWVEQGERVALTCYERLPSLCHRHCVARALEAQSDCRLVATHL